MSKPSASDEPQGREIRASSGSPPPPPPAVRTQSPIQASAALAHRAQKGRKVRKRHDSRGKLIEKYETKDGLLHGIRRVWAPSGQLLVEARYRMGKPHGVARSWNVHGQLVSQVTYKNGQHCGSFLTWWDNGRLKEKGTYFNEQRVGWYVWFDADGTQLGRYHYAVPAGLKRRKRRKRGVLTRLAHALRL